MKIRVTSKEIDEETYKRWIKNGRPLITKEDFRCQYKENPSFDNAVAILKRK